MCIAISVRWRSSRRAGCARPGGSRPHRRRLSCSQRRLDSIVAGYLDAGQYDYVDFLVLEGGEHRSLRARLQQTIDEQAVLARGRRLDLPGEPSAAQLRVVSWYDPLPAVHAGLHPFPPLRPRRHG